ncbi:efflux RND transporter periplasmic adaptor subunit [Thermosediminibacter oceani]|uniref:Efflux transporter, RND family, MFP subunit n=1 Tax=Thermosediminibacter oceani (strain ATCC BAA-1034 / DSM 16646 / JW/IW-1228P) TaxID=555079 RepID=D9S0L9_THEOJ|nr:efflux RND transporter periplasmic adaptor subunit [Thermosediminibacter oceani]ADL08877.1 efflux transporter, RND family, MFP subunit [Thermosediminibacter oceani DSM 16646]
MHRKILAVIAVVAVVVVGGFYAFKSLMPPPKEAGTGPVYSTAKVIRGDISVGVETSGPLNPNRGGGIMVPYNMEAQGGPASYIIEEVLVKEGDGVKAGQPLVRLRAPGLQGEIESLEQQLETAKKSLAAKLNVEPHEIYGVDPSAGITLRAPVDGRVIGLKVKEGAEIKQGDIVARVVDDSKFRITARLNPGEFEIAKDCRKAFLRFNQFEGVVEGKITDINTEPVVEPSPGSGEGSEGGDALYQYVYYMTIEGDNPGLVQPGMTVQVGVAKGENTRPEDPEVLWLRFPTQVEGYSVEETITSTVEARVTKVHVKDRNRVKKGDAVISLTGSDVSDMLEEELEKVRELEDKLRRLYGQYELLEIKSPMDGVVANINAQPGRTVQAGEWLGHIYNAEDMQMWAQVDDVDVLMVKQGSPVKVTVDALPGKVFEGKVMHVATMGKDMSGVTRFEVSINVKGTPELRPGMQARAYIEAGSASGVLLVPVEAVFEEDGQPMVEVLQPEGTTKVVRVELGLMNDRYAEIKSGLEEGWAVVTGSSADILPGQRIKSNEILPGTGGQQENGEGQGDGGSPQGKGN